MTPPGEPLADPITELRRLTDALLDRLQPWLSTPDTLRDHSGAAPGGDADPDPTPPPTQRPCPLCALLTAVRGDRAELTRRLTTHGLTALATLRELLEHHSDHPGTPDDYHHTAADPTGNGAPTPSSTEPATHTPSAPVRGARGPARSQVHHIPVRRPAGDPRRTG